ncbi:secretion protein HlyD [Croceicoccus estronivorus]|uniref:secretion protein HlyD n=1 Tax=Croceicoccus estronivorus TaxID=1172626 RepID=UPI00082E2FA5|nr:secretion protein HlyD [Croceicoccus estronivorus]OCC22479.1 secretion protein HlyD [Croceicoccus estronivorus]
MNRRKAILIAVGAVLLLAATLTKGFGLFGDDGNGPLTLYGNVDIREVDLAFRVGGRIDTMAVDEGDKVTKGQVLAVLDTATLDSRLHQADAQVASARAQFIRAKTGSRPQEIMQAEARAKAARAAYETAQGDYDRRRGLVDPGAISRAAWDQTVARRDSAAAQLREAEAVLSLMREGSRVEDVEAAAAQLKAAEAARDAIAIDTGDAKLLAPSAGTILTRAREPGAIVQPTETVFTLTIDRPMRVRAYVAESDLSRIAPGMAVTVTADGNPKTYHGKIGYISPRAEFTPKTVQTTDLRTDLVYRLRIVVSDPDGALRQGQPVTVDITKPNPARAD